MDWAGGLADNEEVRRSALIALVAVAAVTAAVVAVSTPIHAQDLAIEWISTRAAADGLPLTSTLTDLSVFYGVEDQTLFPGYFSPVVDPSTPGQLVVNTPLLLLPLSAITTAAVVWTLLTGAGLVFAVSRLDIPWYWAAAAFPVVLWSFPGIEQLQHGQFSFLIAGLLALTLTMARRKDSRWAGVPVGLAIGMKLYLWLVIPALWAAGRRRAAVGAAAAAVGLNLVGLVVFDLSLTELVGLAGQTAADLVSSPQNGSLMGVLGIPSWLAVVIGLAAIWLVRGWTYDRMLAVVIATSLLIAPITWAHYLPIALVGVLAARQWAFAAGLLFVWVVFDPWSQTSVAMFTFASLAVIVAAQIFMRERRGRRLPAHPTVRSESLHPTH